MTQTTNKISLGQIEPIRFADLIETPTTLEGYGIADALTETQSDGRYLRYDAVQELTEGEKTQALANLGITSLGITLTEGEGIEIATAGNESTISFNKVFGDNRYHRRLSLLGDDSVFQLNTGLEGLQVRQNIAGSTGFPTSAGSTAIMYSGGADLANSLGRTIAIHRTYNTENFYLGSANSVGVTNPWRLIYHTGNLDLNTVLRTGSATQVRTGLLRLARGSGSGEIIHAAFDFPDNDGEDYNLRLYNDGTGNNVKWYWKQKVVLGTNNVVLDNPVLAFKNNVTLIGVTELPFAEVETYYDAQTNPAVRYPLEFYVNGDSMFKGRLYAGKNNLTDVGFLTADDTLYSEGTLYAKKGLRTPESTNKTILDASVYFLGASQVHAGADIPTHDLMIEVDGVLHRVFSTIVS